MEAHSPRPEHMQLGHGIIIPKTHQSSMNQMHDSPSPLPQRALSGLLPPLHLEQRSLNGLLPSLPLEQRSMDHEMMMNSSINSSTTANNNNSSTNNNLDTLPRGFPSPPQSPRPNKIESIDDDDKYNNVLITQPVWNESLTTLKYENLTKGFISKYRIFKDRDSSPTKNGKENYNNHNHHNNNKQYVLRNSGNEIDSSHYYSPILSRNGLTSTPRHASTSPTAHTQRRKPRTITHRPAVHSQHHTTPNVKWDLLPDFSPNWDTLPKINTNKSLKVEWKGSTMDLSHDPLRGKLHPAELNLAQILRLPCELYLDSKRRLFMAKVDRLKQSLPFRRTDAQKACHIDVNKASKLYSAFERVGWLDDELFTQYL